MKPTTAVICALFNPDAYRFEMLSFVARQLKRQDCPVEVHLGVMGDLTYLEDPTVFDQVVVVEGNRSLFQKEALWNATARALPQHITHFVFLDSDIFPTDTSWLSKIVGKLEKFDLVQGFSVLIYLTSKVTRRILNANEICFSEDSMFDHQTIEFNNRSKHNADVAVAYPSFLFARILKENHIGGTGGCIAMKRSTFERMGGFPYEEIFAGLNDMLLFYRLSTFGELNRELFTEEFASIQERQRLTGVKCGFVPVKLYHLYHKSGAERQYGERARLGKSLGYSPQQDIYLTQSGGIELTAVGRRLEVVCRHISDVILKPDVV